MSVTTTSAKFVGYYELTSFDTVTGAYTIGAWAYNPYIATDDENDIDPGNGVAGDGIETALEGYGVYYPGSGSHYIEQYTGWTIGDEMVVNNGFYWLNSNVLGLEGQSGIAVEEDFDYGGMPNWAGHNGANDWTGDARDNVAHGLDGHDTLNGMGGDDFIYAGDGNDSAHGGAGKDTLYGGYGDDELHGDSGNDKLYSYDGDDLVTGGDGNDLVYGQVGNDQLLGGNGADVLNGGKGNDTLDGESGADTLTGGGAADVFTFSQLDAADVITDFSSAGGDRIHIEQALVNIKLTGALLAFRFVVGTDATAASHRFVYDDATGNLYYDADGSNAGTAVQIATLSNLATLSASDIVIV